MEQDTCASEFFELYMSKLRRLGDEQIEAPLIVMKPNYRRTLPTNDQNISADGRFLMVSTYCALAISNQCSLSLSNSEPRNDVPIKR
jgi:hypothetical protein